MQHFTWCVLCVGLLAGAMAMAAGSNDVTAANTRFGFKLLSELDRQAGGGNIFISPSSISWCLSMVWNGAQGQTRQEMADALEINGIRPADVNAAFGEWKTSWAKPDPKITLQVANSIWTRSGFSIKPEFLETNKRFFFAEVRALNVADPHAADTINGWVKSNTGGKIDKIIESVDADSVMFLLNAIYFKGKWSREFDAALTKPEEFTAASGAKKKLPMMHQEGEFQYFEQPDFQSVSLPYGDRRMSLYLFLPAKTSGLAQFQRSLTADNWSAWMKRFQSSQGQLALPRFRVEYEQTLNAALRALGMKALFDPVLADLRAILQGKQNACVSAVKHKSFVEVNEEGTEAAAATSAEVRAVSAMIPRKPFRMIVDRPFFFAIRDNTTGAVLFLGSIKDPG